MKTLTPSGDEPMSGPSSQDAGTINLVENERNMHLMPNPYPPVGVGGGLGRMIAPAMGSPAPYIAGLNASQSADYMFKLAHGLPLSAGLGGMLPPMMGGGMMPPVMANGGMMPPMMGPGYMGMPPPIMPAPVPVPVPVVNPLMGALNSYPMLGAAFGAMNTMGNLMHNFNGFGCGCNGLNLNMPTGGCGCGGPSFPFSADPISYMLQWVGGSIGSLVKYALAFYGFYLMVTKDGSTSSSQSSPRRSRSSRSSRRSNYDDRYDDDYAQTGVHHYDDESLTELHSWERQLAQITKEWADKKLELSQTN